MSTKTPNPLRPYQLFFIGLGAVCVLAIVVNLIVRRGPVHDATAESDLRQIASAIDAYASSQSTPPPSLTELTGLSAATQKRLADYEYAPSGPYSYQLCAIFQTIGRGSSRSYVAPGYADPSQHGKGRQCFSYTLATKFMGVPAPLR